MRPERMLCGEEAEDQDFDPDDRLSLCVGSDVGFGSSGVVPKGTTMRLVLVRSST